MTKRSLCVIYTIAFVVMLVTGMLSLQELAQMPFEEENFSPSLPLLFIILYFVLPMFLFPIVLIALLFGLPMAGIEMVTCWIEVLSDGGEAK